MRKYGRADMRFPHSSLRSPARTVISEFHPAFMTAEDDGILYMLVSKNSDYMILQSNIAKIRASVFKRQVCSAFSLN